MNTQPPPGLQEILISLRERGYPEHEQTKIVHSQPSQLSSISMVPYSSIFHSSWSPVAPKGGKLVSEAWKIRWVFPTSILSYTFARLLLPLQGSDTSATCPFPRGWQVTNPLKTPDSSLTQFSTSDKERNQDTLLSPSPPEMEVTLSLSLSLPRKHHISKPRQWQTAKCRSAHFAIYLDLHISIMVLLLSGKYSDCPDQSIHKGDKNFPLAL